MTTKYTPPTVESIIEDSGDETIECLRGRGEEETTHRHIRSTRSPAMKANGGKGRERAKKSHRSGNGKHNLARLGNNSKKATGASAGENGPEGSRRRHRRTHSNRSTSSTSSEEEDEPDHRAVLAAARARLTSPSLLSTFTTQTTATNKSSSSSGSNSTVTQASITKRPPITRKADIPEAPLSPAVPDPPNVFAFMETDSTIDLTDGMNGVERVGAGNGEEQHEEDGQEGIEEEVEVDKDEDEEEDSDDDATPQWPQKQIENGFADSPPHVNSEHASSSSSAASSFHGEDSFSEPPADNDTDRSTSPERSVKGHDDANEAVQPEAAMPPPSDRASAKLAAQMAAAQQRQNLYAMQQFGTPNMPRGNTNLPHIPPAALSTRHQQQIAQRPLPRAEKLPVTGYELLATTLASYSSRDDNDPGARIKPMYRKFEALNHRVLLHLQDELSELEEQLHRLDHADTQSRRTDRHIIPASRRAAAMAGGELQWHKTDVLGRIGFKLAQYNQALSSFNDTQSLSPPSLDDIENYRDYLHAEHPIAETETHFLDPIDDLVSISSEHIPPSQSYDRSDSSQSPSSVVSSSEISSRIPPSINPSPHPSTTSLTRKETDLQPVLPALAGAIAVSVLVPILTFTVIPGFMGRMTVTMLVAMFMVGALFQATILGKDTLIGREAVMCAGIYGGVMTVIAGIMG